jgi:hypothetical protein
MTTFPVFSSMQVTKNKISLERINARLNSLVLDIFLIFDFDKIR